MSQGIIEAGLRRLRAVVLTASTTVVSLWPTAYGWVGFKYVFGFGMDYQSQLRHLNGIYALRE